LKPELIFCFDEWISELISLSEVSAGGLLCLPDACKSNLQFQLLNFNFS
jgi:hypothetical protein